MSRDTSDRTPGGFQVCAGLVSISRPFNVESRVELKYVLSPCHGILGGSLLVTIAAEDAHEHMVGDEVSIRVRRK